MKMSKFLLPSTAALLLVSGVSQALADSPAGKEITITGNMVCGKCTLHITKSCQNVVQVTKDGKTVNYFLVMNDVSKDKHDDVCGGGSEKVTVTGTLEEKDGKEVVTPTKIDVDKS